MLSLRKLAIHDRFMMDAGYSMPSQLPDPIRRTYGTSTFFLQFCIKYIPLNSVTRIIAFPIPRCNSEVNEEFGQGNFFWLFDAPRGYQHLAVTLASQEKLTFQGPDAIKWTYTIMPPLGQQMGSSTLFAT